MSLSPRLCAIAVLLVCAAVPPAAARASNARSAIVGGSDAPPGAWPSVAYLRAGYADQKDREHEYACTGSVVAPQWVVTAGHCTFGAGKQPPDWMVAILGVSDYTDPAGQRIPVDRFVPDPSYDPSTEIADIGLVHLAQPTGQPPMPLATSDGVSAGSYLSPANVPNAAGWGAVDQRATKLEPELQQAYLEVHDSGQCAALIDGFDPSTQTCAGTPGAAGVCHGDSGGPLTENDRATGQRVLWGITAYGPQITEGLAPCSLRVPAVFTWIPAYAGFIQSTVGAPAAAAPEARTVGFAPRGRTRGCTRARAALRVARRRERTALRRLRVARRERNVDVPAARRRYHSARAHRRRAAATATRRCRVGAAVRGPATSGPR
jgi:secreted trypsin-like serine protease